MAQSAGVSPFCILPCFWISDLLAGWKSKAFIQSTFGIPWNVEMCQLFRGEDYPTVYGTNAIPKFHLGRLVAYCPTVKTSESFRNNFDLHFEWNKKKRIHLLALEQVIKSALTGTNTEEPSHNLTFWIPGLVMSLCALLCWSMVRSICVSLRPTNPWHQDQPRCLSQGHIQHLLSRNSTTQGWLIHLILGRI